jgi:hypothetical protein
LRHRKRRKNEGEKNKWRKEAGQENTERREREKGIRNHFCCVQFLLNHTEIIKYIAVETYRSDPSENLKRPVST